jgi:hypothetical protein
MEVEIGKKMVVTFTTDSNNLVFYEGTKFDDNGDTIACTRKDGVEYFIIRANVLHIKICAHEQEKEENPWQ